MARPHIAALIEDAFFSNTEAVLRARGWQERLIGYTGYGTVGQVRVMARVLLSQEKGFDSHDDSGATISRQEYEEADVTRRGWRAFLTAPAMNTPVRIRIGQASVVLRTDRGGYLDAMVPGHGLEPGWHDAELSTINGDQVQIPCRVVDAEAPVGVVSDIDDTVMITHLPRPLIAAWNTFVRSEQGREEVPGMASFYRSLLLESDSIPIFYVSTGAWNTAPTLTRFLRRHDYPSGPLLLTDWGPTNTGWFRSGQVHKASQLERLATEFPAMRWILVGDDGQHDPALYGDFARRHPGSVEVIAIRRLTPAQQVLSHGLPVASDELVPSKHAAGVPMVKAADGFTLHTLVQSARQRMGRLKPSSWVPSA
ncbi:MAG: phosphatase domain-containing protein [Ornithinimicrobium sp.]